MVKLIIILCLAMVAAAIVQVDGCVNEPYSDVMPDLQMGFFFEALCPDSTAFFVNQLLPTHRAIGKYFYVDLTAFGHAQLGKGNMTCQNGPEECVGNRRMGCIIERTKEHDRIGKAIETIVCLMQRRSNPDSCIKQHLAGIAKVREIKTCTESQESMKIMRKYKKKQGVLTHVPFLTFKRKHDPQLEKECRKDLLRCICNQIEGAKPSCCREQDNEYGD